MMQGVTAGWVDEDPKWESRSVNWVICCWFDPLMANTKSWKAEHQCVAMAHLFYLSGLVAFGPADTNGTSRLPCDNIKGKIFKGKKITKL